MFKKKQNYQILLTLDDEYKSVCHIILSTFLYV